MELLPVYLADTLCLSVAVAGNKYCIFGRVQGHRRFVAICGKLAAVSHRIWQTGLRNVEKLPQETVVRIDGCFCTGLL